MKKKICYCNNCGEKTIHHKVGSESQMDGENGVCRAIVAFYTAGISELVGRTKYYQCTECKKIKEID